MRDTRINANSNLTCVIFEKIPFVKATHEYIQQVAHEIPNKYTILNKIDYVTDHFVLVRLSY